MEIQIANQLVNDFLRKQPLVAGLDDIELSYLVDVADKIIFGPGELIFAEGERSNDLYFIFDGKVSIIKTEPSTNKEYLLGTLEKTDSFGDLAFLDDQPRSSSVKATAETTVLKISKETTYSQSSEMTNVYNKIMNNIAKISINRLRETNESSILNIKNSAARLQDLINAGKLFIVAVMLYWTAELLTARIEDLSLKNWIQVISVSSILSFIIYKFHKQPSHFFGLTGISKKSLKQPLWIILGLFMTTIITFFIGEAIHHIYPQIRWINFKPLEWNFFLLSYPIYVFLKEFIVRGVIQTNLKEFIKDDKDSTSVLYTSVIMGIFNLPLGFGWGLLTFFFNYPLSYLYNKQRNLLTITLIHVVLGTLFVVWSFIPQKWLFNF